MREIAVSTGRRLYYSYTVLLFTTLFMEVFCGYYMLVTYFLCMQESPRNKKKTHMLLLQRFYVYIYIFKHYWPLSRYIVFHIHFLTTSRILLRFRWFFFHLEGK